MSRSDENFIINLQNFTASLQGIVDTLQSQSKNDRTDLPAALAEAITREDIEQINTKLDEINKNVDLTKSNTAKILQELEKLKKSKETGLFDKVEDKKNKKTIADGVKTVVLIAGGVLAIGMAFKIVGKVDFMSVISLSIGIMAVTYAFDKISKDTKITSKKAKDLILVIASISVAILASALILQLMPTISISQGFSVLFVGITIGIATYAIIQALDKVNLSKNKKDILLLPAILPIISLVIVASGLVLMTMPTIPIMSVVSALLVGIALIPITLAFGFIMKATKNMKGKDVLLSSLVLPIIAGGLVVSSYLLNQIQPIENPLQLLISSVVMGVALLAFIPAFLLIGRFLSPSQALKGGLSIVLLSVAIAISSQLFSMGDYSKFPSLEWSASIGLVMLALSPAVMLLGLLLPVVLLGSLSIIALAGTFLAVDSILSQGSYEKFPSLKWSSSVGLAIVAFSLALITSSIGSLIGGIVGLFTGESPLITVTKGMIDVATILNTYDWNNTKTPSLAQAGSMALLIMAFSGALVVAGAATLINSVLGFFSGDDKPLNSVAQGIVDVAKILNDSGLDWDTAKHPTKEWAEGVGLSVSAFANALSTMQGGIFDSPISPEQFTNMMITVSKGLVAVGMVLNDSKNIDWENAKHPTKEWAEGVGGAIVPFTELLKVLKDGFDTDPEEFVEMMTTITTGIVEVAKLLNDSNIVFDINKTPSVDWGNNISAAISSFTKNIDGLKKIDEDVVNNTDLFISIISKMSVLSNMNFTSPNVLGFTDSLKNIFSISSYLPYLQSLNSAMVSGVDVFNTIILKINSMFTTLSSSMDIYKDNGIAVMFSNSLNTLFSVIPNPTKAQTLVSLSDSLQTLSIIKFNNINEILMLSSAIDKLSGSLNNVSLDGIMKLSKLGMGFITISLVDENKLNSVMTVLKSNENKIKAVLDYNDNYDTISSTAKNNNAKISGGGNQQTTKIIDKTKQNQPINNNADVVQQLVDMNEKIAKIVEFVDIVKTNPTSLFQ